MEFMRTDFVIKVSGTSRASAVAGAIAAGAVNWALKGSILAVKYLNEEGISVAFVPAYTEVVFDGNPKTAIQLTIRRKEDFHKEVQGGTRSGDT